MLAGRGCWKAEDAHGRVIVPDGPDHGPVSAIVFGATWQKLWITNSRRCAEGAQ